MVHFTGTGRFLDNESGRDLVDILQCMRSGKTLPEALWAKLQARELDTQVVQADAVLRQRFFRCHWGGFSWEQVSRLQQLQAAHEAEAAGQTLYYIQAVDRSTDGRELTARQTHEFESGFDVNHWLFDGNGSIVFGYGGSNFCHFENTVVKSRVAVYSATH